MDTQTPPAYLLGHDDAELARLQQQARLMAPPTDRLLQMAGIAAGMRVLDLGSGPGDVAFLAAARVGPAGLVVGIDSSPAAIEAARHRAQRDKIGNVSFLQADIRTVDPASELGGTFDAVIGRLVLLYVPEPVEVVARCAAALRPGGVLLAMEYDMTVAGSVPSGPLGRRAMAWLLAAFQRTGHDPALGTRLIGILAAAGFDDPVGVGMQAYVGPDDPAGACLLAATIRTLLPAIQSTGIATADEVLIDTLQDRLWREQRSAGAVIRPPTLVGAWART